MPFSVEADALHQTQSDGEATKLAEHCPIMNTARLLIKTPRQVINARGEYLQRNSEAERTGGRQAPSIWLCCRTCGGATANRALAPQKTLALMEGAWMRPED